MSHLQKVGRSLDNALGSYNAAVGSFERNVTPQARTLHRARRDLRSPADRSSPPSRSCACRRRPRRSKLTERRRSLPAVDAHENTCADPSASSIRARISPRPTSSKDASIMVTGAGAGIGRAVSLALARRRRAKSSCWAARCAGSKPCTPRSKSSMRPRPASCRSISRRALAADYEAVAAAIATALRPARRPAAQRRVARRAHAHRAVRRADVHARDARERHGRVRPDAAAAAAAARRRRTPRCCSRRAASANAAARTGAPTRCRSSRSKA